MGTVERRVKTCRMICKMQKYPEYSKKLGLVNRSVSYNKNESKKGRA